MLSRPLNGLLRSAINSHFLRSCQFHTLKANQLSPKKGKVAVCGSSGGIGQPLALLLKGNEYVSELRLYDIQGAPGVTADLSHIETGTQVSGFSGKQHIEESLKGADVVLIPAGVPRKPGMTRDDLFNTNASICADIVDKCAQVCPDACICVITNPVNSTIPIAAEVLKHRRVHHWFINVESDLFNKDKLFGVTTLDVVRTNTFVSQLKNIDITKLKARVVAGHSPETIVPLLSQIEPHVTFTEDEVKDLTERIKNAGTEVVNAKAGAGSATLSMAYAAARFANALLAALSGQPNVVECTMTASERPDVAFFSEPHLLGKHGVEKRLGIGKLSPFEESLLEIAIETLKKNISKGVTFGKEYARKL